MAIQPVQKTRRARAPSATVREVVQRILAVVPAQRIVLFGSAARGEQNPDSDLDFLVIVAGPVRRRQIEGQIYRNLRGILTPVDVIVATEEDIQKYGDRQGAIFCPALREGQVVYDAGA